MKYYTCGRCKENYPTSGFFRDARLVTTDCLRLHECKACYQERKALQRSRAPGARKIKKDPLIAFLNWISGKACKPLQD